MKQFMRLFVLVLPSGKLLNDRVYIGYKGIHREADPNKAYCKIVPFEEYCSND